MKSITINGYTADELQGKALGQVLENFRDINVTDDWYQPIVEGFKEKMETYGIECEVQFTGFYSQGDGACFISQTVDTDLLIRKLHEEGCIIPEDCLLYSKDISVSVEKVHAAYAHRYCHENTVNACVYNDSEHIVSDHDCNGLETTITEWVRENCRQLYADLEKYYDSLTDDEAILAELVERDYYFTEHGTLIPG